MRSAFPISLLFIPITGIAFAMQIGGPNLLTLLMLMPLWSIVLVNAGMIGIAAEALTARVGRGWIVVPISFYGMYYAFVAWDHAELRTLQGSYDAASSSLAIPFDPDQQALVFESDRGGDWIAQNFAVPVVYSVFENSSDTYRSTRIIEQDLCDSVHDRPALQKAGILARAIRQDATAPDDAGNAAFCTLIVPETPGLPQIRVERHGQREQGNRFLPVRPVTTTVTTPDGRRFKLHGGTASPLPLIPLPALDCGSLDDAHDCEFVFIRTAWVPLLPGDATDDRDDLALARALGLKRVSIGERRQGTVPEAVLAMIARSKVVTPEMAELAAIDEMIANPDAHIVWDTSPVGDNPAELVARKDAIMRSIERGMDAFPEKAHLTSQTGPLLADLLARLPSAEFNGLGPRVLALYDRTEDAPWLWNAELLIRRLGDLGVDAVPHLIDPRATSDDIANAGIEGLCRVGAPGRAAAEPALLRLWASSRDGWDRDKRIMLYVAMRRMGIVPPPLADDKRSQLRQLRTYWADVTPASPARVCATGAETLRRERGAKSRGKQRRN